MPELSSRHKSCSKKYAKAQKRHCSLQYLLELSKSPVIPLQPENGVSVNHILFEKFQQKLHCQLMAEAQ